jgi:hypothetical protein
MVLDNRVSNAELHSCRLQLRLLKNDPVTYDIVKMAISGLPVFIHITGKFNIINRANPNHL